MTASGRQGRSRNYIQRSDFILVTVIGRGIVKTKTSNCTFTLVKSIFKVSISVLLMYVSSVINDLQLHKNT